MFMQIVLMTCLSSLCVTAFFLWLVLFKLEIFLKKREYLNVLNNLDQIEPEE